MEYPSSSPRPSAGRAKGLDRLESWKDIAEYLHRDVRTVQRWERLRGLPVRRLPGGERARIYAIRGELDAWWDSRGIRIVRDEQALPGPPTRNPWLLRWLWPAGLTFALLLTVLVFSRREETLPNEIKPVALTSYSGIETTPSLSPDGKRVAFAWNGELEDNFDIYVKQIGVSGAPLRLTTDTLVEGGPAWSPNDRWIAFWRQHATKVEIILVPPLGGPERKLADIESASVLSWTPDAKWLTYGARESPDAPSSIWAINLSSGVRRQLTQFVTQSAGGDSPLGDSNPSVSPDGRALAFARQIKTYVHDVYVQPLKQDLRLDGQPLKLTDGRYAAVTGIAWTPDARDVVYGAGGAQMQTLWRVSSSGKRTPSRLPYALPAAIQPVIAGTPRRLVYTWWLANTNIWRLDMLTGERRVLISSTYEAFNPQYSSDGRKIVFQSNRSGNEEIWTCGADGSNCVQITSFGGPLCGAPRWSPDGRFVALDSRAEGQPEIYVVSADGGEGRRLTNHPANDIVPGWSHDGLWIYFSSDRSGRYEIWKIPRDGGEAVQVTHAGGFAGFESPDGKYIYYTRYYITSSSSSYFYQGLFNLPGHFHEGLFKMPVQGGREIQILSGPLGWLYGVTSDGVYFQPNETTIQFLNASTGGRRTVAMMDKPIAGVSISPDSRYAVWSQPDRTTMDLMLVEGFR